MKRLIAVVFVLAAVHASGASAVSQRTPDAGTTGEAEHALNRLAFGARPGEVDRVAKMGVDQWIDQQLHPERIPDAAVEAKLARYKTLTMSNDQIAKTFVQPFYEARRARKDKAKGDAAEEAQEMRKLIPAGQRPQRLLGELSAQRILRAAESERQLHEVMVDFWMNHFNVFAQKGLDRFYIATYERDTIRPRVWGRFEDLLMATAKSPAMLFYLDNARSRRGAINENYAREIMELHTVGVDGGYTQNDVTELARVFTGWSTNRAGEFVFRPALHDSGEKTVLGHHFRAGGGIEEGETMIRILARHPSTARFLAAKLCQRLVSDTPPPALVDRIAKRYLATNGDLRETVKAVVTSPEFRDPRTYRAKVKSPFEYTISAVRAAGATIDDPLPIARELRKIGEPLYAAQPPTGYSDKSEAWSSDGALVARLNFVAALAANKMPGVRVNAADSDALTRTLGAPEFQKQ
jgi:uncharacterized protein (DUF1800 family)